MIDDRLTEALAHLYTASAQLSPTDDEIISDHIKAAHALLASYCRSARVAPLAKTEAAEVDATSVYNSDNDFRPTGTEDGR